MTVVCVIEKDAGSWCSCCCWGTAACSRCDVAALLPCAVQALGFRTRVGCTVLTVQCPCLVLSVWGTGWWTFESALGNFDLMALAL